MDLNTVRLRLRGILVYAVTPFQRDADLSLDEEGLRHNVQYLVGRGVRGIVPCGGTGEFWSLTPDEYRRVVEAVRSAAGAETLVVPGVGGCLHEAIRQVRHAEATGCEAVMIFTPPGRISEAGLVAYFCAVAEQTQLGVIPYLSMPVSLPSLEAMIAIPTVVAVKDATGDLAWFRRASRVAIPEVNWFCEGESLAPYYLLHYATGVTSGVANFVPELSLELYDAAQRGDFRRAAELQRLLDPWAELRAKLGNLVPVIKAAMDRLGLAGGPVRLPLLPLVEADVRELDRLIATLPRKAGPGAQEEQTA